MTVSDIPSVPDDEFRRMIRKIFADANRQVREAVRNSGILDARKSLAEAVSANSASLAATSFNVQLEIASTPALRRIVENIASINTQVAASFINSPEWRSMMQDVSQQYRETLATTYSVPKIDLPDTSYLTSAVAQIIENISAGVISPDVIRAAEKFTADQSPEFAADLEELTAEDSRALDRVSTQAWKVLHYAFALYLVAYLTDTFEADSLQDGLRRFMEAILAVGAGAVVEKNPFAKDEKES